MWRCLRRRDAILNLEQLVAATGSDLKLLVEEILVFSLLVRDG